MANFRAIKISRKQRQLQNKFGFTGLTRELSRSKDCFEYLQKFPTKPSYPPKKLAKISLPKKNPQIENLKPKKSFDHLCQLKSKSRVPPLGFIASLSQEYGSSYRVKCFLERETCVWF